MKYRYDIHRGIKKLKTKTFVAISTLGLILGGGGLSLAMFGSAHALTPTPSLWQLNAPRAIVFNCGGSAYNHNLVTVSEDSTGAFTGTGSYVTGPSYTWGISGNVSANNITFKVVYDASSPNPGYTLNGVGTIAPDGSVAGTVDNNCSTFTMPAGSAVSTQIPKLDWKSNVQCANKIGKPVVDVTQKVKNDADSGTAGNTWALDNYNRHIQVWATSTVGTTEPADHYYCATVTYDGSFKTFAGPSPQNTSTVGPGVTGNFEGGYMATFTGTPATSPIWATHGNIGTFDYACTPASPVPGTPTCLGYVDWTHVYFGTSADASFTQPWWGWQYDTCQNGSWINSLVNSGDITGSATHKDKECHQDNNHHENDGDHGRNQGHHDNDHHDKDHKRR